MKPTRIFAAIFSVALLASACGGNSSSTDTAAVVGKKSAAVDPKYATFCAASTALDEAMGGTHGEDPTAITDPKLMKTAWAQIAQLSAALRDASPEIVRSDAAEMVESVIAIDTIFRANDYDLLAMAKKEDVRTALGKLSSNPKLLESSTRFNTFLVDNCGKTAASTPQN